MHHFKARDLEFPNISFVSQNVRILRKYEQKDISQIS